MEICDDPEEMRKVLARARDSRSDAKRKSEEHSGQQNVSDAVRSAAGKVMSRLSQDAPTSDRSVSQPSRDRKARISDVELLWRAADMCKREGRGDEVVKEVEVFLRSSDIAAQPTSLSGKYAVLAKHLSQRKSGSQRSRSGRSSITDGLKTMTNIRPPRLRVVMR